MHISQHAAARSQQRGISSDCITLIIDLGAAEKRPGGALEYKLRKKDKEKLIKYYKHKINMLNKAGVKAILIDGDTEEIITVYNLI
jgi:hypothetical protein